MKQTGTMLKKTQAWKWTSKYIRFSGADKNGVCKCATCGCFHFWSDMDCGHAITAGLHRSTFFDLIGLAPQCKKCNRWQLGQSLKFEEHIIKEHGQKAWDELKLKAQGFHFYTDAELKQISDERRILFNKLKELK